MNPSPSRSTIARLAVGVTALVAGAFTVVPAQAADEPPASEGGPDTIGDLPSTAAPVVTTSPAPVITTPTNPSPTYTNPSPTITTTLPTEPVPTTTIPTTTAPSPTATTTTPTPPVEEEVEADFGYQKFRVGVRAEDGTTNTANSRFEVTFTGSTNPDEDGSFECVTQEPAAEDGTTWCPGNERSKLAVARASSVGTTQGSFSGNVYNAPAGATVTVRQLSAAAGLIATPTNGSVAPCRVVPFVSPDACVNDNLSDGLYSTVRFVNGRPVSTGQTGTGTDVDPEVAGEEADLTAAAADDSLPDTGAAAEGGSPAPWLGALMIAGGAGLIGRELRPARRRRQG